MQKASFRSLTRRVWPLVIAALAGCASAERDPPVAPQAPPPPPAAATPVANFSAGLRCMDTLMLDHGARDLSVLVEDLADPAGKAGPGSKEMLIAAVSDMSRRSRAVRIVTDAADKAPASFQALRPQYVLRGGIRRAADGRTLGLDLTLLTTHDLTVVPGVAARIEAVDAQVRKFGVGFALPIPGRDTTQAVRAMAEMGAIELFGRLAKVPYWSCLGATDADPDVDNEIRDWHDAMVTRPKEIIEYFQQQLRLRGAYDGPIDGTVNPALKDAVARYREALGLAREPKLTREFLKAYLGANHRELKVAAASVPTPVQPGAPAAPTPLTLRVASVDAAREFRRGQAIQLDIKPSRDAHVYCFLLDEGRQISRFFPNRFQRDSRIAAGAGLQLPGAMRFEFRASTKGVKETVSCFATERDVLPELPATLAARDFAPLPVASLEQVRDAFQRAAGGVLAHESLQVQPR